MSINNKNLKRLLTEEDDEESSENSVKRQKRAFADESNEGPSKIQPCKIDINALKREIFKNEKDEKSPMK